MTTSPPTTAACRRCGGILLGPGAHSAAAEHCTRECATIDADTCGPWRDRFHWRPMVTAPRDGSSFVSLRVITHLGGWSRPIDSVPELTYVRRAPGAGYWRAALGPSIGDQQLEGGWWTTLEEYSAAVAQAASWRSAPSHVPGFICCPLVFVRPPERRDSSLTAEYGPVLEATVTWPHGNTGAEPERWSSAHTGSSGGHIHPGVLNGDSGDAWRCNGTPMRWMMLSEFFPEAFFRREIEQEKAAHAHRLAEWSRRATAPRPAVCAELDELWDGELPPDRAQAHREHLAWCDRCSKKLLGRMQEAAACLVK